MVVLLGCTTMLLHWERVLYIYMVLEGGRVVWVWTVTVVEALLCTLLANDVAHNGGIVGLTLL